MTNVYPFQVPAASARVATRGRSPRDTFRVATLEVDDARTETNAVAPGGVRTPGKAAGRPGVERPLAR